MTDKIKTEKVATEKAAKGSFLERQYKSEVVAALQQQFGYKNAMRVPRLTKIVLNTCLKEAVQDGKLLDKVQQELALIAGQRPVLTLAKKSISNFKLRQGQAIGCAVTLRRKRMYEFLNRFINVVLPRVRDFKGVSPKGFDGRGNYTLGLTEHTLFPEIPYDKVTKVFGMNISIVTTATNNEEGKALLKGLGMPFRGDN